MHQPNLRGLAWWEEAVPIVLPHLTVAQRELIEAELAFQRHVGASAQYAGLPRGPIHADLFRDNVMFEDDALTGFFDFYFAGVDTFLFDIAVCLNDWCIDLESGRLVEERAGGIRRRLRRRAPAYRQRACARCRPCCARRRCASGSRGCGTYPPRDAAMLKPHDPEHFERVLRCAWRRRGISRRSAQRAAMKFRHVPARQGARWVREGLSIFVRKPLAFCVALHIPARRADADARRRAARLAGLHDRHAAGAGRPLSVSRRLHRAAAALLCANLGVRSSAFRTPSRWRSCCGSPTAPAARPSMPCASGARRSHRAAGSAADSVGPEPAGPRGC